MSQEMLYLRIELAQPSIPNAIIEHFGYYRIEQVTENYEFYPHILHAIVSSEASHAIHAFYDADDSETEHTYSLLEFNDEDSESMIPDDILYHYYQI